MQILHYLSREVFLIFYSMTAHITLYASLSREWLAIEDNCNVTVNFVTTRATWNIYKKIEKKCFHRRFSFDVFLRYAKHRR